MALEIFSDDEHEGKWFQSLSSHLTSSTIIKLNKRGTNPDYIEKLIQYDRPDIILVQDENPILVLEKTSEVPTGHNVGQRFGRLVKSVEQGIMTIFFVPFIAMKHGQYASVCKVPARLFLALQKMQEIHNVPVLAIEWPSDNERELINDGSENTELSELIDEIISNDFVFSKCKKINELQQKMIDVIPTLDQDTISPPSSVKIIPTADYVKELGKKLPEDFSKIAPQFEKRAKTLIYKNEMTEENCRREDPYTGQQFIYDYMECRNGPEVTDKHTNLVLSSPLISKKCWEESNPNDPNRKSALWYATADLIELKDGIIIAKSKIA